MLARTQWWNVLNKAGSSTRRSEISSKALLRHWISKFAYAGESFWERCGFQIWHDVLWAESTAIGITSPRRGSLETCSELLENLLDNNGRRLKRVRFHKDRWWGEKLSISSLYGIRWIWMWKRIIFLVNSGIMDSRIWGLTQRKPAPIQPAKIRVSNNVLEHVKLSESFQSLYSLFRPLAINVRRTVQRL